MKCQKLKRWIRQQRVAAAVLCIYMSIKFMRNITEIVKLHWPLAWCPGTINSLFSFDLGNTKGGTLTHSNMCLGGYILPEDRF